MPTKYNLLQLVRAAIRYGRIVVPLEQVEGIDAKGIKDTFKLSRAKAKRMTNGHAYKRVFKGVCGAKTWRELA